MFDPIVISMPLATAATAALALGVWWLSRWLEEAYPLAFAPLRQLVPAAPRPASGRHRIGGNRTPYRPIAPAVVPLAEAFVMIPLPEASALPQREPCAALAAEMQLAAAADNRDRALPMPVPAPSWRDDVTTVFEVERPRFDDVSRVIPGTHPVPCGYPDVTPCICSVQQAESLFGIDDGRTRELEQVR